ncbi:DUF6412 domain-containing protein [Streptomyces sp. NPDC058682]|uniref:DUF6412 domain-containing protein n=1 Tax=unclassified Streptomyces TaxID=2593676 RepID=UPI002259FE41|nr:DUF6412 domain-containing protein [Streptomyces sp. NBC_01214]MCX4801304.1 DUF6412 domain-containing protein [Streptomyces sp. NBC_01214]
MARQRHDGRLLSCALFARTSRALALLLPLVLLGGLLGLFAGEGGLGAVVVALAATVAVGTAALAAAARLVRPVPPHRIRTAIRDREQRTAFLPQRDPDASGRSRPRAPGRLVPTAA